MSISNQKDLFAALEEILQKTANRLEVPIATLRQELQNLSSRMGFPADKPLLPEELLLLCLLIRTA